MYIDAEILLTKLVTDIFIRRMAQIFLISIGASIAIVCIFFVILAIEYRTTGFLTKDAWKYIFLQVISFPFDSSLGTFLTGLSAIIPIMLASVCFSVRTDVTPPKAGADLNHIGHIFVILLSIGIAFSVVAIFIIGTQDLSAVFTEDSKIAAPKQLRALFGAFLAVQGAYLTQLIKDKD